jgi:hypothetical protein
MFICTWSLGYVKVDDSNKIIFPDEYRVSIVDIIPSNKTDDSYKELINKEFETTIDKEGNKSAYWGPRLSESREMFLINLTEKYIEIVSNYKTQLYALL